MPHGCLSVVPTTGTVIPRGRLYGAMAPHPMNPSPALLLSGSGASWQNPPPTVFTYDTTAAVWEEHVCTGDNPLPLTHHTCNALTSHGGLLMVTGGCRGPHVSSSVCTLDAATWEWRWRGNGPHMVHAHSSGYDAVRGCVYIFGGEIQEDTSNMLYQIDVETWEWSYILATSAFQKPRPRMYHSSCTTSDRVMYIYGGAPGVGNTKPEDEVLDDLWAFDMATHVWKEMPKCGAVPSRRGSAVLQPLEASPFLLLFGGFDGATALGDGHLYDTARGGWMRLDLGTLVHPRVAPASFVMGLTVFVHGGMHDDTFSRDFHVSNEMLTVSLQNLTPGTLKFMAAHFLV